MQNFMPHKPELLAPAGNASCALAAESEELMALFYRTDIEQYAAVFGILIFGIIPIGVTYVYGTLLTAGGELRRLNLFATGALVLNVVNVNKNIFVGTAFLDAKVETRRI